MGSNIIRLFAQLAGVLFLAIACTSKLERCVNQATSAYNNALAEQAEIEASIARGYTIDVERVPYQMLTVCHAVGVGNYPCLETRYRREELRVPVNAAEARRRSAEISRQLPRLQSAADIASERCHRTLN